MDGLSVLQCYNPEKPWSSIVRLRDPAPEANSTVSLDLAPDWPRKDLPTPLRPDIGALKEHLFVKIARRLQTAPSGRPRRVFERGGDVTFFEIGEIAQDFGGRRTTGQ